MHLYWSCEVSATLQPGFVAWIERAMVKPMPAGLVAFNFNLAEAFQKFQAELIGASCYDPGDSDWACDAESVSDPRFLTCHIRWWAQSGSAFSNLLRILRPTTFETRPNRHRFEPQLRSRSDLLMAS